MHFGLETRFPFIIKSKKFQHLLQNLGFGEYLADVINKGNLTKVWLECLLAFIYQVAIFYFLDLSFWGWFLCYYAFALHWSALQYVDHAWSPRDIINGAWNLKVSKISRLLALNYHYHLAHHQNPEIPWNYLPELVKETDKQPSFWSIYFSLWGGVRPAPAMINIKSDKI